MTPSPAAPLPRSEEAALETALREQLIAARHARTEALRRLKVVGAKAAEGTPADSAVFRLYQRVSGSGESSGLRSAVADPEKRVELRREQVAEVQAARRSTLDNLKRTAYQAVKAFRDTAVIDKEKLQAALAEKSLTPPAAHGA